MRNKRSTRKGTGLRGQIVVVAITLLLCIVVLAMHAPDKWLAAIYCTVPTFAGMIEYFRSRLAPRPLWALFSSAFLLHLALLWLVFGVFLRERADVPLLICIPAIFLESFVLYHAIRHANAKLLSS